MQAWLIEYTSGRSGQGYQIMYGGVAQRLTDLDGETIEQTQVEYTVLDTTPAQPAWVDPDPTPPDPDPVPTPDRRLITVKALWQRATLQERIALEMASLDNPASTNEQRTFAAGIRVWIRMSDSLPYFDLAEQSNRVGIQALETYGILGAGRATEILDAPIQDAEKPIE